MATEQIEGKLVEAKGRARKMRDRLTGGAAAGPGAARDKRLQLLVKLRALLTQTPADAGGKVEGTEFTTTGVAKLMETLKTRAADEKTPGARVAGSLHKFLSAEGGEAAVAGASVQKLQLVSDRMEKAKGRVAKARKG